MQDACELKLAEVRASTDESIARLRGEQEQDRERQDQMNNAINQSLFQVLSLLQNGLFEGTIEMEKVNEGD